MNEPMMTLRRDRDGTPRRLFAATAARPQFECGTAASAAAQHPQVARPAPAAALGLPARA